MTNELMEDYRMAKKGLDIWKSMKHRYDISVEWSIVFFPEKDFELNRIGLELLPQYLERKFLRKALVVSAGQLKSKKLSTTGIYMETVTEDEMDALLKYYRLVQFVKNIVVVSYREPFGTGGIIGREGILLKDYVRDAIYA